MAETVRRVRRWGRDERIHKVTETGLTELEMAYGADIDVKVASGAPSPVRATLDDRLVRRRREAGLAVDAGTLAATKISSTVAVVTVRRPQGGYRCVAVAAGGAVLELFSVYDLTPTDARAWHNSIVVKVREYLAREGIVDFSAPLVSLFRDPKWLGGAPARRYGSKPFVVTDSAAVV